MPEPTFRTYTPEEARQYALGRAGAYPSELYDKILTFHERNGGRFESLLDVACGPGKATKDIAPLFETVTGIDHSDSMIMAAREANISTRSGDAATFEVGNETLVGSQLEDASVDLITAAMSAHWFNMEVFWPSAARVLKDGGTVAIWACSSQFCHPSTPNASKVQEILSDLQLNILGPYTLPENWLSHHMYDDLTLPWQCAAPATNFPSSSFERIVWNRDGKLSGSEDFLIGDTVTMPRFERIMSTASMVSRWRQAHPTLAGTDQDCVKQTVIRLKEALGEGVDGIRLGCGVALLLFKKHQN